MLGSYIAGVHKIFTKLGPTSKLWLPDVRNAARSILKARKIQASHITIYFLGRCGARNLLIPSINVTTMYGLIHLYGRGRFGTEH
jgi:hypothetical protein